MAKKDYKKTIIRIQIVLFILFLVLWFISSKISLLRMLSIGILIMFSLFQLFSIIKRKSICFNKAILVYILFTFWCVLSVIWARDGDAALSRSVDLMCNISFLIVSYDFFMNSEISKKSFISIFIVVGLLFSSYIILYYGVSNYFTMLANGQRIGRDIINVNFIGLISSITFLMILYSVLDGVYKNKLILVVSIIPLITAFGSGSRKALIGLAFGLFFILFFFFKGKITRKKIIVSLMVIIAIVASFFIIKRLPYFDTVFNRMGSMFATLDEDSSEVEGSTYARKMYIEEGLKTFSQYPITGIGLYNSKFVTINVTGKETYLHCNYVELLACVGIIGFILYYSIYVLILKKGLNAPVKLPIIIIIVFFATEIGAVTYYEIKTAMYLVFMLVLLEKNNWLYSNEYKSEKNDLLVVGDNLEKKRRENK